MKKNFVLRNICMVAFTMLLMLFALPQCAQAVAYELVIISTPVTSSNCNDLSVIPGVEGTVKYDPEQNVLDLNNATITATGRFAAINTEIPGLTIRLTGINNVSSDYFPAIAFFASAMSSFTITGDGSLNASSSKGGGIYVSKNASLTIKDCTVNAKGNWGISGGTGTPSGTVIINKANFTAHGNGLNASIYNLESFSTIDSKIIEPSNASWDSYQHAVCYQNGNEVTGKVVIQRIIRYNLWIGGVQLTSDNYRNISEMNGVEGTVNYNPSSKTLSLTNATINSSYTPIKSDIPGLIINVQGTNTLNSTNDYGMSVFSSTTISGNGLLNISATRAAAIDVNQGVTLTIKDCAIDAKGRWGICGQNGTSSESVIINNAGVIAQGNGSDGSICDLQSFYTTSCQILEPTGAVWNSSKHAVCDASGNKITGKVVIGNPYAIWIAGVQVSSANCRDLSVIDGVEGTASYNPSNKTLFLTNASITTSYTVIESNLSGLIISVAGTNTLKSTEGSGIYLSSSATISGSGSLSVLADNIAIYVRQNVTLTIRDCTLNAKGHWGITGDSGELSEKLVVNNATLTAQGSGSIGSICDLQSFSTIDCKIVEPVGAVWSSSNHAICDGNGNKITSKVVIERIVKYGFWIAGEEVTSENCRNLSVIDGVEGTASYNPSNKTLSLTNASITTSYTIIESNLSGLIISVAGTNTLKSTEGSGIYLSSSATISGSGSLSVLADNIAIYVRQNVTLTIRNCTLNAKGHWGITGDSGELSEKLVVNNATLTAQGSGSIGSICDLQSFSTIDCKIVEPVGAVWNSSNHAICDGSGNKITSKVVIERAVKYDLWVADVQITSENCGNLSVISGVEGTVSYDPVQKVLHLEDAIITTSSTVIESNLSGLIIDVVGNNMLTSNGAVGISLSSSGTISGTGSMNVLSANVAIYVKENVTLTIRDCSVNANGMWGISGWNGTSSESLVINNANVTAKSTTGSSGSICDLQSFSRVGCDFVEPAGAMWSDVVHAVCDGDGNKVKGTVVIMSGATGITSAELGHATNTPYIYTLDGKKVNKPIDSLDNGIYIIDGKKVIMR